LPEARVGRDILDPFECLGWETEEQDGPYPYECLGDRLM
jgi:hypothetical protein